MSEPEWWGDAACAGVDPEAFFPDSFTDRSELAVVRSICGGCPVKDACLADALSYPETADREGIFGGLTPPERKRLRKDTPQRRKQPPPPPRAPVEGRVDATGTRWRLRALAAHGWPTDLLAVEFGTSPDVIRATRHDRAVTCPGWLAERVAREWPRMSGDAPVGKSARSTRSRALRSGWPRPCDLDMTRVDDPAYTPIRQEES